MVAYRVGCASHWHTVAQFVPYVTIMNILNELAAHAAHPRRYLAGISKTLGNHLSDSLWLLWHVDVHFINVFTHLPPSTSCMNCG